MRHFSRLLIFPALVFTAMPAHAQVLTGYDEPSPSLPYTGPTGFGPDVPPAIAGEEEPQGDPVDLEAENLVHDEATQTITASGNVFLTQTGRILRADQITYNLKTDTVVATGHVVLNQENDDIYYSERVVLKDQLKNGFVNGLKTYLKDGSRFTAKEGSRKNGTTTEMKDATYTPCEPCKKNPEASPVWQIVASDVTHDETEHRVSYKNARFEVYGVPVAYTPYFSHPDGSIKRKSGFLSPSGGFKSRLGTFVEDSYYWAIAPDKDATFGLMAMTAEDPLAFGQWRQRWDSASLELEGGITNSSRTDKIGGTEVREDKEVRGHVLGKGLWDINEKWRSGVNVQWASDDQYMRQYDFTSDDVLENEVFLERFSGRNYGVGRLLSFQDIRVTENPADQPDVLPEIITSFVGEPGAVPAIKGRWNVDASLLGLRRSGNDQDMNRLSLAGGWERRMVSDYGLLTNVEANIRGDFYNVRDRDAALVASGLSEDSSEFRSFPYAHAQSSYPLVKPFEKMQAIIEPLAAVTIAQNLDISEEIPNEDSQDSQLDAGNLFEPNRFPGLDRVEDKSRATYGVRTGLYGYNGSHGDIFLGQSYRFDDDDNPFPNGSGLDDQRSDVVGQISAGFDEDRFNLNYRFQLDSESLSPQRHEVDAYANWERLSLAARYLYAKSLGGTNIDDSREQIQPFAAYYLSPEWRTRMGGTYDMSDEEDSGLREAFVGLDYYGQCVSTSLTGVRSLTNESSGDSNTEIIFRIGLKNMGEFEESGYRPNDAASAPAP